MKLRRSRVLLGLLSVAGIILLTSTGSVILPLKVEHGPKAVAAKSKLCLGAYYFDGWADSARYVTADLRDKFNERRPVWGWRTSTAKIMRSQIDVAVNSGLSFFSFCWYFPTGAEKTFKDHPLNQAIKLYQAAPNKQRLKFSLLVANHQGSEIGPEDWEIVTDAWIQFFKDKAFLRINGKPYITFFSAGSLIEHFGSAKLVSEAFDRLKQKAKQNNLPGVTIGVCVNANANEVALAKECEFDIFTGYNHRDAGFSGKDKVIPIERLNAGSYKIWELYKTYNMPYIPVVTLNWDARPWVSRDSSLANMPRYTGYSSDSIYQMIFSLKKWMNANSSKITSQRVAMLYAWNEYGEGAWLTPSKNKRSLLQGIKRAVK